MKRKEHDLFTKSPWGHGTQPWKIFRGVKITAIIHLFSGIFRDSLQWDPLMDLMVSSPYYSHKNPWRYGKLVWVPLTIRESHVLGSPWNHQPDLFYCDSLKVPTSLWGWMWCFSLLDVCWTAKVRGIKRRRKSCWVMEIVGVKSLIRNCERIPVSWSWWWWWWWWWCNKI